MSAQDHHQHSAQEHPHDAPGHGDSGHHEEPAEETLAPDESPTPMWLPVLGAVLFFVVFIFVAAF